MLPHHACCVLSCLRCNGQSLLLSAYLSGIGRIENPFCNACGHSSQDTSHLILHCPATDSLTTLCLSTTSSPDPGWLPGFWGSMVSHHAHIPRKGSGKQPQHWCEACRETMRAEQNFTLLKKCRFSTEIELMEALLIKCLKAIPKHKTRSFTRSEIASAGVLLRGTVLERY